jgi:uncharacterized protein YbjT (DUF2867 family)
MTVIAVTGATGHVGGRVARLLADLEPRLIVRDPGRAPEIAGATIARASYDDLDAAVAALRGVDALFMVSASESRTRRDEHRTFIRAAAEAGVGHLVYTSLVGAAPDAAFTLGRDHHDAEQAIVETGLAHTFLRDNFYLDVLPYFADEEGVIRGPAGDGRTAAVARADVADVATRMSTFLGRPVRFEDETVEQAYAWRKARYGAEDWQLDAWVSTYTAIRDGEFTTVTDDVRRLTGHEPRSLEDVLRGE